MTARFESRSGRRPQAWIRGAPILVRMALALLVLGWVALLVLLIAWGPGEHPGRVFSLYLGLMFGSSCVMIARGIARSVDRPVWLALGAAMFVSATGDAIYVLAVSGRNPEPFPSIADPFYLAYYPLAIVAVVVFVRRWARGVPRAVWWDGSVLALAVGGFVGALFLAPLKGTLTGGTAAVVVGAAYPFGDTVILLIAALGVTLVRVRRAHALLWIAFAMAVAAIADLMYWNLMATDSYVEGTWLDALWPLSYVVLATGAWMTGSPRVEAVTGSKGLLVIPGVSLLAATATLAFGTVKPIPILTVAMAVAALLGVLNRLNATVRQTVLMMAALRDATTDELTGLLNRRGFAAEGAAILEDGGAECGVVLVLLDLDGFKEVNDSLGHQTGDDVLRSVAARLIAEVERVGGVLGRLGGDEFSVLLPDAHLESGLDLAARVRTALALPFEVDGTSVTLTASIGIASGPEDGADLSGLLRRADIAMYRAKADHVAVAIFNPRVDFAGEDRLRRIAELRTAIGDGELVLHYQPKIGLLSGRVEAVEALVRWDRPMGGLVYPDEFLPLVRSASLLQALTASVLRQAAAQSALWRTVGIAMPIAVNLPAEAFVQESLPSTLDALLRDHELPGAALQVEITEEALLNDPARAQSILRELRRLGVQVAIDDYGTGYSSLVYLRELMVDEVKIDRSFIAPMMRDARSSSIVRSTIDLVHALGLKVVAEGVEDAGVAELLTQFGCDTAQGFHWTRALPAVQFEEWLCDHELALATTKRPARLSRTRIAPVASRS